LSADTFASWIHAHHSDGETVNLFMDYETFGEHQWEDTGIFEFLRALPRTLLSHPDTSFKTPTETVQSYEPTGEYDVPDVLTWADTDRDLTAWTGNDIQRDALAKMYAMEADIMELGDEELIETWRKLQTSDHFYYMCTKWSADGDVHAYFSPYQSPYDAYIAFMNAFSDLQLRVQYGKVARAEAKALAAKRAEARAAARTKRAEEAFATDVAPSTSSALVPVTLRVTTGMKVKAWFLRTIGESRIGRWFGGIRK
jgi:alpha-amylase